MVGKGTRIVFSAGFLLAAGCATSPPPEGYYEDPQLSESETAVLDWGGGVWGGNRSPDVTRIDGKAVRPLGPSSTRISPGKHVVEFSYSLYRGLLPHQYVNGSLAFEAEPAHSYRIETECAGLYGGGCESRIMDETAKLVVAGGTRFVEAEIEQNSANLQEARRRTAVFEDLREQALCGAGDKQYDLALYYLAGLEPLTAPDPAAAYAWFQLAALSGQAEARAVSERLVADLSQQQRAEAEAKLAEARQGSCPRASGGVESAAPPAATPTGTAP
ncbi:MAG TPA: hypothetical protein VED46_18470 [Alphaproteobacteria bacterium]|nr:hypothetical protein [Alphaproteobacteria bacterium]